MDEKLYGTLWTRHVIRGESLHFQDSGGSRVGFLSDNTYRKPKYFDGLSSGKITT